MQFFKFGYFYYIVVFLYKKMNQLALLLNLALSPALLKSLRTFRPRACQCILLFKVQVICKEQKCHIYIFYHKKKFSVTLVNVCFHQLFLQLLFSQLSMCMRNSVCFRDRRGSHVAHGPAETQRGGGGQTHRTTDSCLEIKT